MARFKDYSFAKERKLFARPLVFFRLTVKAFASPFKDLYRP